MKRTAIIIIAASVLQSCSGWLDRNPQSFVTPDDIKVETDLVHALNGAYNALIMNKTLPISLDFISDNGFCNDPTVGESVYWRFAQTPSDMKLTLNKWSQDYAGILRANTVIQKAEEIFYVNNSNEEISNAAARKACHIAEAKVLRAFFYTDLINYYGDCPWRTEPEGLEKKISPRVDKNTIISNLIMDLDEAAADLPVKWTSEVNYGHITRGAALAVKARLCLYNGFFDWCAAACRDIIALGVYSLHPSYAELFTEVHEKNNEYIFTQQYIPDRTTEGASGVFWSQFSAAARYMVSYNFAEDFYMTDGRKWDDPGSAFSWNDPYANRDPRLALTMDTYSGTQVWGTTHTGLKMHKFITDNPERIHNNDGVDFPLIRYADVLLMLAESLTELDDYDYDEVCGLVNQVRRRGDVMMPTIAMAEEVFNEGRLNRNQLMEVIRHERRVELGLEGLRLPDIRRWDIGAEAFGDCMSLYKDPTGSSFSKIVFAKRSFDTSKGYLWPIPAIEVQTNPMSNNPGYYD